MCRMPVSQEEHMSTDYVITVRGHLEDQWSAWFEGMTITNIGNGEAVLAGPVRDQAALHGLLIKIRDLGLPLIAVVPGSTPANDGTGKGDT
jgi:hypothetical protein